jgi:hypothetical protein
MAQLASDQYEDRLKATSELAALQTQLADQQQQLANLRAILTSRPAIPEVKIARRFSEVRAALQQGDEDAA